MERQKLSQTGDLNLGFREAVDGEKNEVNKNENDGDTNKIKTENDDNLGQSYNENPVPENNPNV